MTRNELLAMPADQYMNTAQLAFFRALLLQMHAELSEREQDVRARLDDPLRYADEGDRALAEEQRWLGQYPAAATDRVQGAATYRAVYNST